MRKKRLKLIKSKIVSFFSVDHIDISDHKYCIDPSNSFSVEISILKSSVTLRRHLNSGPWSPIKI